jgi:hypothetical protein
MAGVVDRELGVVDDLFAHLGLENQKYVTTISTPFWGVLTKAGPLRQPVRPIYSIRRFIHEDSSAS